MKFMVFYLAIIKYKVNIFIYYVLILNTDIICILKIIIDKYKNHI